MQPRNAYIARFVIALPTPSRYCQPQGTSPNFTTAPTPCQIHQTLFFIVLRSASASLPPHPPHPTTKTKPANQPQARGAHSLTLSRPLPDVKSSPLPRIPPQYPVPKQVTAYIPNLLPLKPYLISERTCIVPHFTPDGKLANKDFSRILELLL